MKFKDLLIATGLSLGSLLSENIYAQEIVNVDKPIEKPVETEREIIKPSLEEIIGLLKESHHSIFAQEIKNGDIKKFEYTRQTAPEDFYRFLNGNFQNKIVFVYLHWDEETKKKNIWGKTSTFDERLAAGSATIFLYTMLNLRKSNSDVGFLFLELRDFYEEENWKRLYNSFNNKLTGFTSYIEFILDDKTMNYKFSDITESSMREPKIILEWISDLVTDYRKRVSK